MKIISDGTRSGTKLYTDSGEEIANVTEFTLQGTASGSFIIVKIKLLKPKVEFEIEELTTLYNLLKAVLETAENYNKKSENTKILENIKIKVMNKYLEIIKKDLMK